MELRSKTDELINYLETDNINPHVLHFSEEHMEKHDLLHLTLPGYTLGSSFFHQNLENGGMCIFFLVKTCISAKLIISSNCTEKILK